MRTRVTAIAFALLVPSLNLPAQAPSAPIPSQLTNPQTVFLASGGAPGSSNEKATAAALYTTLYQSLAASGRYHLVATPAEAGLSMVLTLRRVQGQQNVISLDIYDVKTHMLLWTIDEPVFLDKMEDLQASTLLFINDLNALANNEFPSDVPAPNGKSAKALLSNQGKK